LFTRKISVSAEDVERKEVELLKRLNDDDGNLEGFVVSDSEDVYEKPRRRRNKKQPQVGDVDGENETDVAKLPELDGRWRNLDQRSMFDIYMQFLVSSVVDPDFPAAVMAEGGTDGAGDSYFRKPVITIERQIRETQEFLLRSSTWQDQLRLLLETRPSFRESKTSPSVHDCEVCGRANHTATTTIELAGVPYDANSLWQKTIIVSVVHVLFFRFITRNSLSRL
jgi:hypothetical protein